MDVPQFLTVEEAAVVLRISRASAYEYAREYLFSDGVSGLPVVRIGRTLRVPRARLEVLAGAPITRYPILPASAMGSGRGTHPLRAVPGS